MLETGASTKKQFNYGEVPYRLAMGGTARGYDAAVDAFTHCDSSAH